jgi:hypothetical protein
MIALGFLTRGRFFMTVRDVFYCMANWRTTACGVLIYLLALHEFLTGLGVDHIPFDPLSHFIVGTGLIFAKDATPSLWINHGDN